MPAHTEGREALESLLPTKWLIKRRKVGALYQKRLANNGFGLDRWRAILDMSQAYLPYYISDDLRPSSYIMQGLNS